MKKKTTIITILYVILCIAVYWGAYLYVELKDERLHKEAIKKWHEFADEHPMIVNVLVSGEKVSYRRTNVPEIRFRGVWGGTWEEEAYGDIDKMYELLPEHRGWCLQVTQLGQLPSDAIMVYTLYPDKVGYKHNCSYYSVQYAVNDAYDFWTTNEKSEFSDYIENDLSMSDIKAYCSNEYYIFYNYDRDCQLRGQSCVDAFWNTKKRIFPSSMGRKQPAGYMQNDHYKVYNVRSMLDYYFLIYNAIDNPKLVDRITLMEWSYAILTLAFLSYLIPHLIVRHRKRKRRREPLKAKLLRLSNPKNFMKPYDETKVNAANEIFARLQQLSPDDEASLKEVRKQITTELGVSFIDQDALTALKEKCNPERFMHPYDEAKVKLANLLYAKLQSSTLSIEEFESIQQEYESTLK